MIDTDELNSINARLDALYAQLDAGNLRKENDPQALVNELTGMRQRVVTDSVHPDLDQRIGKLINILEHHYRVHATVLRDRRTG